MGRLTKEMVEKIRERYEELRSYSRVAKELGLDPRTVKKHVLEGEEGSEVDKAPIAYKMFSEGKTPIQVAIELGLRADVVREMYREYWELKGMHNLTTIYNKIKDDLWTFLELYRRMREEGLEPDEFVSALKDVQELRKARSEVEEARSEYIKILDEAAAARREREKIVMELQFTKDFVEAWFGRGVESSEALNRVVNALLARKVSPETINKILSAIGVGV